MNNKPTHDTHCDYNTFKRARYFHGMLMTDRDFREEQIYHNEKRKLLNRMLHSWGIVCGLEIQGEAGKSSITVKPGMALDCHGNEILVCDPVAIDISSLPCRSPLPRPGTLEYCQLQEKESTLFHVGIRYHETPSDPVPVYAPGGGCEEKVCEYSRIREGFCIEILDHQPCQPRLKVVSPSLVSRIFKNCEPDNQDGKSEECQRKEVQAFSEQFCGTSLPCPECCPEEHFIILGSFEVDRSRQIIKKLNQNSGRSLVPTSQLFSYLFSSLAGGLHTFFNEVNKNGTTQPLPDVNLIGSNPLEALCWLGRVFAENANIEAIGDAEKWFKKKIEAKPEPDAKPQRDLDVIKLKKELDALKTVVEKMKKG